MYSSMKVTTENQSHNKHNIMGCYGVSLQGTSYETHNVTLSSILILLVL